ILGELFKIPAIRLCRAAVSSSMAKRSSLTQWATNFRFRQSSTFIRCAWCRIITRLLVSKARHFLKSTVINGVSMPLVCDVFLIDVVTEFLDTPLRCLSYQRPTQEVIFRV